MTLIPNWSRVQRIIWAAGLAVLLMTGTVPAQTPGVKEELDVPYGEAGGQKLLVDIFRPETNGQRVAAIVFVHGGGWSGGDKKDFRELARGMARQGYASFCVGYRLVKPDGNRYPAQLDDVQRAVRWIRGHAAKYNVDPNRIGAMGGSAGGHLAALLGTTDTRDNSDPALAKYSSRVTCVVDIFGPADLTADFSTNQVGQLNVQTLINNLLGKPPKDAPKEFRDASPIFRIDAHTVPFLIFHGSIDPLVPVDQSRRFDAALRKAGIESKLIIFEGEGHGFGQKEHLETFVKETRDFYLRHLKQ